MSIGNANAGAIVLTSALTDAFPAGMTINTAGNTGTCTGVTATAGAGNFSIANGNTIPAGGCTVIVNVTSSTAGAALNSIAIGDLQTNAGSNALATSATLNVYAPPTVTKTFTPATIGVGGTSSMVITVTNPAANVGNITGVVITDTYIGTLVNNAAGSVLCSGAGTATLSGGVNTGTSVGFTAGTIVPGGTCTITQSVSATSTNLNTTSAPTATGPVALTGTAANATLTVTLATVAKTFTSASINDGGLTSLRFTLTNAAALAQSGIVLNDTLPTGLRYLTTTPAVSYVGTGGACTGPATASYNIGTRALAISGISLGAGTTSCNIDVAGLTNAAGQTGTCPIAAQTNLIANVTATNATVAGSDQCLSVAALPTLTKAFGAANIAVNGTTTLTFSITNTATGNIARSGLNFTDTLQAGIQIANPPVPTSLNCGTPVFAAVNASQPFTASSIDVAANTTCTITLTVRGVTAGARNNTAADITAINALLSNGVTTQTLNVYTPPTISKLFGTNPINAGASSALTFTITNPAANPGVINTIAFTDLFPTTPGAMTLANATTSTTCGGTVEGRTGAGAFGAPATGNSEIRLTGATTLAAGATCTVAVNIIAGVSGSYTNTSSTVTAVSAVGAVALTGNTASANLTVNALTAPVIAKSFLTTNIAVGGTSTLRITVQNTNAVAITGAAFTDTYPAGSSGALTATATPGTCTGTLTATAASLVLASGVIPATTTCTFDVVITGNTAGAKLNSTGAVTSTNAPNGTAASATLNVYAPPTISKVFGTNPVNAGVASALTFTITNPAANPGVINTIAFTDLFPTTPGAMTLANATTSTTCGGTVEGRTGAGAFGAPATGNSEIRLTGATTLAAGATCTVAVNIIAGVSGSYTNTSSTVTAVSAVGAVALTGNTASANLTVNALTAPVIAKSFLTTNIAVGGTSTLRITVQNTNAVAITGAAFTDTYPAGSSGALTATATPGTCTGTLTATAASLVLASGVIPATTTCTFDVVITGNTAGAKLNSTGAVTSTNAPNGTAASATLNVYAPPTVTKSFVGPIDTSGVTTLTFTLANPATNPGVVSGIAVSDTLPTAPAAMTIANSSVGGTCVATVLNQAAAALTAGDTGVQISAVSLAAGASCTVAVNVTASIAGSYVNTSGTVTATAPVALTGGTASDTLVVRPRPLLTKAFADSNIGVGQTTTLTFNIDNTAVGAVNRSALGFTDTLPGAGSLTAVTTTPQCGGGTVAVSGVNNNIITVSGAAVNTGLGCTITATITGVTAGSYINGAANISAVSANLVNNVTNQTLNVRVASVAKTFGAASINDGATTTLNFTLTNGIGNPAQSGMALGDTLPTGLRFDSATPAVSYGAGCSGPALAAYDSITRILSGISGVAMSSGTASCVITVSGLTNAATQTNTSCVGNPAAFTNLAANVTTTRATNASTDQCLLVSAVNPTLTKAWSTATILDGAMTNLVFTLTNSGTNPAQSGISFTESLPSSLRFSSATPTVTFGAGCSGSTVVTTGAPDTMAFSGVAMAAATASCTVTVVAVTNRAGLTNASCAGNPAAFTNASTNISLATGVVNGVTSQCLVVNAAPPVLTKGWGAASIIDGASTTLVLTLTNTGTLPAQSGIAFTESLPTGLRFTGATPTISYGAGCSGSSSVTQGTPDAIAMSSVAMANGTISCTITVNGVSNRTGQVNAACGASPAAFTNTSTNISAITNLTNSVTPQCLVVATQASTITKAFSPATIAVGGTSTITLTVTNPNSIALTAANFTDTLTNMRVSGAQNAAGTCVGAAGNAFTNNQTGLLNFAGLTIPAAGNCTVTLLITSNTPGVLPNATSGVASAEAPTGAASNTANLTVNTAAPSIVKSFVTPTIALGGTSQVDFAITNPNAIALTAAAFSDTLANMFIHATAAASGTCTGAGSNSFTVNQTGLLNFTGLTIPASGSCVVSIVIRSNTVGVHPNFATGVASAEAPTGANSATVNLTVTAVAPSISKSFSPNPIASGASSTLLITITNPNAAAITVTSVTDTFPTTPGTGLSRAAIANAATSCVGGVVTHNAVSVTLTGGNVPANSSCTFQIDVTAATAGAYVNTIAIGALTTNAGSNAAAASATLNVTPSANVSVTKSGPATIAWGTIITYTATVSNAGPDAANLTVFSDNVPAAITGVAAVCGLPTGGAVCGAVNVTGNSVTSTIATLPAGASVTFTITGTAPQTGTLSNVATAIVAAGIGDPDDPTRTGAGNNTAAAVVTTVLAPDLRLVKSSSSASLTVGVNASFTLTPSNSGNLTSSGTITVVETLPTGLTYVAAGSGGTGWTCTPAGQVITCTSTAAIAAAGTGNAITINVQVLSNAAPGITNTATIAGGNEPAANAGNNSAVLILPVVTAAINTFLTDGAMSGLPGASVLYTHTFNAGLSGSVSFAATHSPSPNIAGWTVQLFRDNNCNAMMDGSDGVTEISAANFMVTAGQQLCINVKSNIPAAASYGALDVISVIATFTPLSGSPQTTTRVDITTVGAAQGAGLVLLKSVRNITLGGVAGTSNTARPGHTLEYVIAYTNTSNSNLSTIALADVTPAFTTFVSAGCNLPLPNNITACTASTVPAVGAAGSIHWAVTGALVPGQTGSVFFRVTVQ